jgi:tetratricopeptide (TPR) repeat protein
MKKISISNQVVDEVTQIHDKAEELFKQGKAKLEINDFAGAIEDLSKSLGITESHYVRGDLGRAKEANGDLEGALADYTKAIEQEKRGCYYQWRAEVYKKMGKTEEAEKDMAEFEKLPKE